jgi:hypothetical protein
MQREGCASAVWRARSRLDLPPDRIASSRGCRYYAYSAPDQIHLIYTLFDGSSPESCNPFLVCTNGSTPNATRGAITPPPGTNWPKPTCRPTRGAYVHWSKSFDGPWSEGIPLDLNPVGQPADVCNGSAGGCISNPAPYIFPNGTVLLLTRGSSERAQNIVLWRADTWNGTYTAVRSNGVDGATNMGNGRVPKEDPTLWRGRRGFHVLLHSGLDLTHAWSEDGLSWAWSDTVIGPPTPSNCSTCHNERPRVLLDSAGDLSVLFVAQSTGVVDASRTASYVYE